MARVKKVIDGKWLIGDVEHQDINPWSVGIDHARVYPMTLTVLATETTVTTPAAPDLVNGLIIGYYPTAQDQMVQSIELHGDGSITLTLAAAATADNAFVVLVFGV